ncbi:hypothetical protein [Amycolatopsis sp. cmx-4-68]|uniref:hypothetical protein n=1 Tax=Amycolatopsis sp. cmx-4-68 TaxID=2790938 RepID=UPI00397BB7E7
MTFRRWRTPIVTIDETYTIVPVAQAPTEPATPAVPLSSSAAVGLAFARLAEQVNANPPDPRGLQPLPDWVTAGPPPGPPNPFLARELRESPDGVLAVRDPRRPTGVRGQPWLVIDAPPGHRSHWRDQLLSADVVQDWTALTPEPRPAPQEQP